MPGGDRTGPAGAGPVTGRGMGYCTGFAMPGYARGGPGMGRGRGFRRSYCMTGWPGWARFGGTFPQGFAPYPYQGTAPAVNEKEVLLNQADFLQKQLDQVQARLKSLEKPE